MSRRLREPISVVMPAFNAQKYIKKSVVSVLINLKPSDELLIIDDGSSIPVESIISEIADSRVRILRNDSNLGVALSLNILLELAKHNLVARMDADDVMLPKRLNIQEKIFAKDKSVDANFMSAINFGSNWKSYNPSRMQKLSTNDFYYALLLGNPVVHSTAMYKKDTVVGLGGYKNSVAEDYELWMRLAQNNVKITKTRTPGILYRKHSQQVTRSQQWKESLASDNLLENTHLELAKFLGWKSDGVWREINSMENNGPLDAKLAKFMRFAAQGKKLSRGIS